jgi:hypothetical protein
MAANSISFESDYLLTVPNFKPTPAEIWHDLLSQMGYQQLVAHFRVLPHDTHVDDVTWFGSIS